MMRALFTSLLLLLSLSCFSQEKKELSSFYCLDSLAQTGGIEEKASKIFEGKKSAALSTLFPEIKSALRSANANAFLLKSFSMDSTACLHLELAFYRLPDSLLHVIDDGNYGHEVVILTEPAKVDHVHRYRINGKDYVMRSGEYMLTLIPDNESLRISKGKGLSSSLSVSWKKNQQITYIYLGGPSVNAGFNGSGLSLGPAAPQPMEVAWGKLYQQVLSPWYPAKPVH